MPVFLRVLLHGWRVRDAVGQEASGPPRKLGVSFEAISPSAAWLAGSLFRDYRHACGPRQSLIPDFLIAAHPQHLADRLATHDRGYLRRFFADLPLLRIPAQTDQDRP
jgi:predicted nucleic acid-binding protein